MSALMLASAVSISFTKLCSCELSAVTHARENISVSIYFCYHTKRNTTNLGGQSFILAVFVKCVAQAFAAGEKYATSTIYQGQKCTKEPILTAWGPPTVSSLMVLTVY
jgi:hypothetical protein